MAKTSPAKFIREVRQETDKVTWPTRRETGITTAMVFMMVVAAAVFFFAVDSIVSKLVKLILGVGA